MAAAQRMPHEAVADASAGGHSSQGDSHDLVAEDTRADGVQDGLGAGRRCGLVVAAAGSGSLAEAHSLGVPENIWAASALEPLLADHLPAQSHLAARRPPAADPPQANSLAARQKGRRGVMSMTARPEDWHQGRGRAR